MKQIAAAASAETVLHPERIMVTENAPMVTKMMFQDASDVHNTLSGAFSSLGKDATLEFHDDAARCCIYYEPARCCLIVVFRGTADWIDVKDDLHLATVPWGDGPCLAGCVATNDRW